jgi:hypothetical protein
MNELTVIEKLAIQNIGWTFEGYNLLISKDVNDHELMITYQACETCPTS